MDANNVEFFENENFSMSHDKRKVVLTSKSNKLSNTSGSAILYPQN